MEKTQHYCRTFRQMDSVSRQCRK